MKSTVLACITVLALATSVEARPSLTHSASQTMCGDIPCDAGGPRGTTVIGPSASRTFLSTKEVTIVGGRPSGCPHRYCGCWASLEIFGKIVPSLNLARNWLGFPREEASSGNVAVRKGHVFVLRSHVGGDVWVVSDGNSGGGKARIHHRSIRGYTIVNPRGGNKYASL